MTAFRYLKCLSLKIPQQEVVVNGGLKLTLIVPHRIASLAPSKVYILE